MVCTTLPNVRISINGIGLSGHRLDQKMKDKKDMGPMKTPKIASISRAGAGATWVTGKEAPGSIVCIWSVIRSRDNRPDDSGSIFVRSRVVVPWYFTRHGYLSGYGFLKLCL